MSNTEALQAARDLLADMPIPDGYYSASSEVISKLDAALAQPAASGEPAADEQRQSMAMMLRKCAHALQHRGREDLAADVVGLLRRYDLLGSPLRAAAPQPAPAPAPDVALRTAVRLVLDATPDQLPMALDALRDHAATAQPAPARVPLTDAQIDDVWDAWFGERGFQVSGRSARREFARAIEAAHGIAPDAQKVAP